MQVDEAIRARRAIKWYDPEHQMPEENITGTGQDNL